MKMTTRVLNALGEKPLRLAQVCTAIGVVQQRCESYDIGSILQQLKHSGLARLVKGRGGGWVRA